MRAPIQLLFDPGLDDLNPIEVGEHTNYPDNFVRPKSFNGVIIHHIRSGCGSFTLKDRHYRVGAGQGFIILPGQQQDVYYLSDHDDPWEYAWVSFTGKLAHRFSVLPPVFDIPEGSFPHTYDLRHASEPIAYLLAADLFDLYAKLVEPLLAEDDRIAQISQIINDRYMERLSIEALSKRFGMDRRELSRRFKAQTGRSVRTYLTEVRMRHAETLLQEGRSAKTIADLCGFSSASNFHKMFTDHYGMTPNEWKARRSK
ncbi:MAG: AraC family transcriptional regulator [Oscillospiraceae bacterium]|nr:AraC family transcriptional regulator [Oscillospiraceae bacterium]